MTNLLTPDAFLAAGWKEYKDRFKPPESRSFQYRARDSLGTLYFVNATWHPPAPYRTSDVVEVGMNFRAQWTTATMKILWYSIPLGTTIVDVMRWADELWTRMEADRYERDDT